MTGDDALAILEQMPPWSDLEESQAVSEAAPDIEAACARLEGLDDTSLREAVVAYLSGERQAHGEVGVEPASKIYVLLRYVYASPARAQEGLPRFGGFVGIPSDEGWVDEAWPWAVVEGRLRLVGAFGGYVGDEYLAVQELDAFRDRFGRRSSP